MPSGQQTHHLHLLLLVWVLLMMMMLMLMRGGAAVRVGVVAHMVVRMRVRRPTSGAG
jgi:hypothetical protein